MRLAVSSFLACLILASACSGRPIGVDADKPKGGQSSKPRSTGGAGATPGPGGTGTTAPKPTAGLSPARLAQPPSGTVPLGGKVRVDAHYMVAAGAGNILSHNGGQIVAAGGGNILGHNGGQLVAAGAGNLIGPDGAGLIGVDGGGIVAAGGGNLVAAGGGNIVAAGAGNIVAAGGGNMVAAGAGNLVAAGGGNMVAAGAGNMVAAGAGNMVAAGAGNMVAAGGLNYRLSQAAGAPAVAFGTQLPAAGMIVWVKSLATGNPVPLGVGPDGNKVWAVFSRADGGYEVFVPAEQKDSVMVVAEAPFRNDRRTGYGLITPERGTIGELDEDTALVTRYLRLAIARRFDELVRRFQPLIQRTGGAASDEELLAVLLEGAEDSEGSFPPELAAALAPVLRELTTEVSNNKNIKTREDFRRVFDEVANVLLADADAYRTLREAKIGFDAYLKKNPEERAALEANPLYVKMVGGMSAFDALKQILRESREKVVAMGPEGAARFATSNPYVVRANAIYAKYRPDLPKPYYSFAKPADLPDFLVTEYLSHPNLAAYGCRFGVDCPEEFPPDCSPIAPVPCIPEGGVKRFRPSAIKRITAQVFEAVGLPGSNASLLMAIGETIGLAPLPEALLRKPQVLQTICRYAKGESPDCPLRTE